MDVTSRQKKILLLLLNQDESITTSKLAKEIGVSKRTVQRECDSIEYVLQKYDLSLIKRKRSGLIIQGNADDIEAFKKDLFNDHNLDVSNINQRRMYLLLELLRDRSPKKRIYFANKLQVSEATITHDLEAIQDWVKKNHLQVVTKPGYGITLEGSEADYREALRRFINDSVKTDSRHSKRELLVDALMENNQEGMYSLLNSNIIRKVERVLRHMNEPRLEALTDEAYVSLVIHIAISIVRIREGGIIEQNEAELESLKEYEDYDLAVRILRAMELEFSLKIPKVEISYLLLHIEGSKINYSRTKDLNEILNINEDQMVQLVNEMADVFDPSIASQLKQDDIFVRGLIVHLKPVIVRLKNHMNIFNPLLDNIKLEYPEIFEKSEKSAQVITKYTGLQVSEEEVGYLAMHFGAACQRIQKKNQYTREVSIGVVCASGFGLARLLITKLSNEIPNGVTFYPFGKEDIKNGNAKDIDFYITSFNLDDLNIDYVQVSPLIENSDVEQIKHKIDDYSHIPKLKQDITSQKKQDDIPYMIDQIHHVVDTSHLYTVKDTITFDELLDELSAKITNTNEQKQMVIDTLTRREKMYSQVLPELDCALLHGITKGVDEISFNVCRTNAEAFTDPYFKGIHAVLLMMIPDDEKTLINTQMLGHVSSSLVKREQFLDAILHASQEHIQEELKIVLQSYFFEYVEKNIER